MSISVVDHPSLQDATRLMGEIDQYELRPEVAQTWGYKDFSDRHIDAIEIMVGKLYAKWGISDSTNFAGLKPQDYPILSDLYKLIEQEYREYDGNCHQLYTAELLQEILLGLHSMCQGAEAQFFNGHTNVTSSRFIVFGVKGLLQASKNVRGAMLFNILSYMSDRLLTIGNTTAALDELYVWLSDNVSVGTTIIEYIRNTLKRVRKKESNLIMASQNLEDFDREGIRELTKPLFAIPPHQFIFNCGSIDKRFYMDLLQLEEAEYNLIRFPQRGVCLFKCGNERYLLEVHAPAYTLDGIKSKTVGDGQHGTARWATKQEIRQTYAHVPFEPELWRKGEHLPEKQGLVLGCEGPKDHVTALVDTDDIHAMVTAASGAGKTAFFLYPNIEYALASGMSFLCTDTKGDLFRNYAGIAKDCYGYQIAVLDLRNPTRSDGNNLLHLINKYMDI